MARVANVRFNSAGRVVVAGYCIGSNRTRQGHDVLTGLGEILLILFGYGHVGNDKMSHHLTATHKTLILGELQFFV